jgi:hypothetical protein
LQAFFQSAQHLYEKREGSGSGSGAGSGSISLSIGSDTCGSCGYGSPALVKNVTEMQLEQHNKQQRRQSEKVEVTAETSVQNDRRPDARLIRRTDSRTVGITDSRQPAELIAGHNIYIYAGLT